MGCSATIYGFTIPARPNSSKAQIAKQARYDRTDDDILDIQDEISREIALTMPNQIVSTRRAMPRRGPHDVQAYRLYLHGRQHWNQMTPEGVETAIELFRAGLLS